MKPVYKCDYCSFMGTEEEVREHEPKCTENYDMKSCYTCKNRGRLSMVDFKIKYECEVGRDIPAGCIIKHCDLYEQKEKSKSIFGEFANNLFGTGF